MLLKVLLIAVVALLSVLLGTQFKDFWKGDRGKHDAILAKIPWKNIWLVIVLALLALLVLFLIPELAFNYYCSDFFRILTSQGGINVWLARAVSLVFAATVYKGLRLVLFNKQRREWGWALLLVSFVAFNLFMYACTRSMSPSEDASIIGAVGEVTTYYCVTDDGEWKLFRHPGYTPDGDNYGPMGEKLKPMTPEAAQKYDAWKRQKEMGDRQKAAEGDKQGKSDAERRFRETYVNEAVVSSRVALGDTVILALKSDPPDSQGDALQGLLAGLLAGKHKRPVSGAFKPSFYTGGLFDESWNGDQSALERLRLLDGARRYLLLCKASFWDPQRRISKESSTCKERFRWSWWPRTVRVVRGCTRHPGRVAIARRPVPTVPNGW